MPLSPIDFQRAEYGGTPVSLARCEWCGRGIDDAYFLANDAMICTVCRERARSVLPQDTRRTYWRAVGVGAVVAVGTSLVFLLLFQATMTSSLGMAIGFGAIGVGYAIGRAMRSAARGVGGRRYQWTAALLSYAAITVATTGAMLGVHDWPMWAYPMFLLSPLINFVNGNREMGGLQILIAFLGIRWAWGMLRPHPLKITGPESLMTARPAEAAPEKGEAA